jgi:hypothetical protein
MLSPTAKNINSAKKISNQQLGGFSAIGSGTPADPKIGRNYFETHSRCERLVIILTK